MLTIDSRRLELLTSRHGPADLQTLIARPRITILCLHASLTLSEPSPTNKGIQAADMPSRYHLSDVKMGDRNVA